MTGGEEPVFSSTLGNWDQGALTNGAQTLQAAAVSKTDTKGGYSSSSLQLDVPAGIQEGSQSYSPDLAYDYVYHYPAAETAQLPSKEDEPYNYDSVNAVQPSTWSSASYMTGGEEPVFSSYTGNWAQAAPVETLAYPSYVAGSTLDSTSSEAAAQPVSFQPLKKAPQLPSTQLLQRPKKVRDQSASTYIIQSKGGYRRSSKMFSKKKYSSGFPPPSPSGLMALRPKSEAVKGMWWPLGHQSVVFLFFPTVYGWLYGLHLQ